MDVLCLGIAVADAIGRPIDVIPEKARLALFDRMELHTGGCPLNTAIALSKLGFSSGLIAKVGHDGFGDFLIHSLEQAGVDTRGVVRDPEASTSFTFIMVSSDGERRFLHTMGANATFRFEDVRLDLFGEARVLCIGGSYLMPRFDGEGTSATLRAARARGLVTCLDTAYNDRIPDWYGLMAPCFQHLDYFLPSVEEAERISGRSRPEDMARFFRDQGCKVVAIKLGSRGCYVLGPQAGRLHPSYRVQPVDTSGAGDSWVAGFLAGLLRGLSLEECADLGNATAAHCILAVGCTTGIRPLADVQAFQKATPRR
ncbi:MAG: carbohydrate kinase family protein [Planctomycetes bacterium]|nr:carbohydrate kinase family protein [Planctomycetota bacterium]